MTEIKKFIITEESTGERLDKFLSEQMSEFSRSEITKFNVFKIKNGDKKAAKFSEKIKPGEEFEVEIIEKTSTPPVASTDFELNIVYEDDDIIVINKPRGVVMYPAPGNYTGTLVQNVLAVAKLSALGGNVRPGVVHRLDKDTSGIVVLAKSDTAFRELVKTFSDHSLKRRYTAFVWEIPTFETASITGNIARSSRNRQKMTMVKAGGKPAQTDVDVINVWPKEKISQFHCTLLTGRTHQIRVHLSMHGFPVLCDPLYGRAGARLGSIKKLELLEFLKNRTGQMLHAALLEFKHPVTGEQMKFKSKLPADMQELKNILDS